MIRMSKNKQVVAPTLSKIVSAFASANSKANLELITPFIGEQVVVKSDIYEVQGILVSCLPSFHKALGGLIIKDGNGLHYVRCWSVIIKGEDKDERDKAVFKTENDLQIHG